jgi:hypothetical protein
MVGTPGTLRPGERIKHAGVVVARRRDEGVSAGPALRQADQPLDRGVVLQDEIVEEKGLAAEAVDAHLPHDSELVEQDIATAGADAVAVLRAVAAAIGDEFIALGEAVLRPRQTLHEIPPPADQRGESADLLEEHRGRVAVLQRTHRQDDRADGAAGARLGEGLDRLAVLPDLEFEDGPLQRNPLSNTLGLAAVGIDRHKIEPAAAEGGERKLGRPDPLAQPAVVAGLPLLDQVIPGRRRLVEQLLERILLQLGFAQIGRLRLAELDFRPLAAHGVAAESLAAPGPEDPDKGLGLHLRHPRPDRHFGPADPRRTNG